jgi:hypothetical protein
MVESKLSSSELFRRAGPLFAQRQAHPSGPLEESQRTLLQDTTLAVVTELKLSKSVGDVERLMTAEGWQPAAASGFIQLVSQLLSKMYLQRTFIFAAITLFTGMIASVAVPTAWAGDFSGLAAGLSVAVTLLSLLALMWNAWLWRKYRQPKSQESGNELS